MNEGTARFRAVRVWSPSASLGGTRIFRANRVMQVLAHAPRHVQIIRFHDQRVKVGRLPLSLTSTDPLLLT